MAGTKNCGNCGRPLMFQLTPWDTLCSSCVSLREAQERAANESIRSSRESIEIQREATRNQERELELMQERNENELNYQEEMAEAAQRKTDSLQSALNHQATEIVKLKEELRLAALPHDNCPHCGKQNRIDQKICFNCNASLQRVCPSCKNTVFITLQACPTCRKSFKEIEGVEAAANIKAEAARRHKAAGEDAIRYLMEKPLAETAFHAKTFEKLRGKLMDAMDSLLQKRATPLLERLRTGPALPPIHEDQIRSKLLAHRDQVMAEPGVRTRAEEDWRRVNEPATLFSALKGILTAGHKERHDAFIHGTVRAKNCGIVIEGKDFLWTLKDEDLERLMFGDLEPLVAEVKRRFQVTAERRQIIVNNKLRDVLTGKAAPNIVSGAMRALNAAEHLGRLPLVLEGDWALLNKGGKYSYVSFSAWVGDQAAAMVLAALGQQLRHACSEDQHKADPLIYEFMPRDSEAFSAIVAGHLGKEALARLGYKEHIELIPELSMATKGEQMKTAELVALEGEFVLGMPAPVVEPVPEPGLDEWEERLAVDLELRARYGLGTPNDVKKRAENGSHVTLEGENDEPSARDLEGIAAKFLQQRQKIKVSQGGPRVNSKTNSNSLSASTVEPGQEQDGKLKVGEGESASDGMNPTQIKRVE